MITDICIHNVILTDEHRKTKSVKETVCHLVGVSRERGLDFE